MFMSNEIFMDVNILEEILGELFVIKGIKFLLYIIIFFISVIGNILVCVVIVRC